ncbi:hypothetical protein, partial [Bradyrhizobium sp. CCBAU 53380]
LDVSPIVRTKPFKQTKVLRSEFHKGSRHKTSSKPCHPERVLRRGNRVNGKERLEIPGELMQRQKRKPRLGEAGFSVGVKLGDASTVRRASRKKVQKRMHLAGRLRMAADEPRRDRL